MDLSTAMAWVADRHPERRAVGGAQPMTYRQWDARTNQLARVLVGLGVRRGDRVAFLLAGGEPLASLHLAAQKLGAVSVPLSTRLSPGELSYCLADSEASLLVTDETTASTAEGANSSMAFREFADLTPEDQPDGPLGDAPPSEDDISVMLYTAGTTGRPKGVPRSHRAEHFAALAHLVQAQLRQGEVVLGVMPMFHTMGLRTLVASVVCGGTWVPQVKFDPAESVQLIRDEGVTSLYLVPTMFWTLMRQDGFAEVDVQRLAYAGAPMTPALAEQLVEAVHPQVLVNHFGSTEIYTFTIGPDGARKPGCAGRAGIFSRVRLVQPEIGAAPDAIVDRGEQGQVIVSMASPEAFGGYWRRPDADAKSIREGWYYTGDLASEDDEGDLWVAGRIDDMIISGGENIYPDEIEDALVRCPAVADICVAGMPHERWGSAVTAFVVAADGHSPDDMLAELQRYIAGPSGLPPFKRPKRIVAVARIPRSAVGKTLRRTLVAGEFQPLAELDLGGSHA